jgi:hypothetical protein
MKRLVVVGLALLWGASAVAQPLTAEPPRGALRSGERVLVDDGTCPPGQIKEVIGGANVKGRGGPRTRRCIPR